MAVKPIPDGYHSVTPYLVVKGAAKALDYYQKAFGAAVLMRLDGPDGKVGHAEFKIGDSIIMIGDEVPQMGIVGPTNPGRCGVGLMIYVEDVDKVFQRAVAAGGTIQRPLADQFYGDRNGTIVDPFGHSWTVSTHKEDVSPEEIERRIAAMPKPPA